MCSKIKRKISGYRSEQSHHWGVWGTRALSARFKMRRQEILQAISSMRPKSHYVKWRRAGKLFPLTPSPSDSRTQRTSLVTVSAPRLSSIKTIEERKRIVFPKHPNTQSE